MYVFVHAQGIKTVHAGEGGFKKWQNSVHVVVEWPLSNLVVGTVTLCYMYTKVLERFDAQFWHSNL